MSQLTAKSDIPVLYKQNTTNDLFQLIYVFDMGNNNDKALGTAFDYLEYLGTSDMDTGRTEERVLSSGVYFLRFSGQRTHLRGSFRSE